MSLGTDHPHRSHRSVQLDNPEEPPAATGVLSLPDERHPAVDAIDHRSQQALCAALDGPPENLPPLIDAVSNDAESGVSLGLEGVSLEFHLSETNNAQKVASDINDMKRTCASKAG